MCFSKLAIFEEANLKPHIEGKKAEDSWDKFEFSSTTEISSGLDEIEIFFGCRSLIGTCRKRNLLHGAII